MRALVTRPVEDAAPLAEALKARGVEPVLAPMMTIRPTGKLPPLDGIAGLLFTSANGVRAFAESSGRRDLPCFAVGQSTADAARTAGFTKIETAGGNVDSLAALVSTKLTPAGGKLLHIAGSDQAGDLAGQLTTGGFTVERAVLYEATPVALLPMALIDDLKSGRIDCVLLFSPRTASLFAERIRQAGLESAMSRLNALCLSKAVADAATLPFASKRIAAQPDQKALLALLDAPAAAPPAARTAPPKPPPPPKPPTPPGAPTNPIVAGALSGLLVSAIVAAIAVSTASSWMPTEAPNNGATAARLDALDRQLAQLKSAPPPAAPSVDLQPLTTRLNSLEQGLAALRGSSGNGDQVASLQAKLDALQQQVADLVKSTQGEVARTAEAATHRTALALASSQLGQAIAAGQEFGPALGTVLGLLDDAALKTQLASLQSAAARGIPTNDTLARRFPAVARDAKAAAIAEEAGGGWYGEVRALLGRLVTIRATDPARGGSDLDNRLARAEAYLESRDLAAAVREMKSLPAPAIEKASGWIVDADTRLKAEAAMKALDSQAVAGLSAGAR